MKENLASLSCLTQSRPRERKSKSKGKGGGGGDGGGGGAADASTPQAGRNYRDQIQAAAFAVLQEVVRVALDGADVENKVGWVAVARSVVWCQTHWAGCGKGTRAAYGGQHGSMDSCDALVVK